ncbi:MAG: glycosyl hydrolase [Microcoleaceae cyanobacterium MO_207.B10]|nr:glycosyl hydrolase [Microcoleaceae cyanobacterium MO_207.B10]
MAFTQDNLQPPATVIPASFFGIHIHHIAIQPAHVKQITPWPEVPLAHLRLSDAYVEWGRLEPEKGKWDFELLDKYIDISEKYNVGLLLTLGQTPPWASARPTDRSPYRAGWSAEPKNIEDWRNYIRTVATRYKGKIPYYEIWNEPNLKGFFSGTPETMWNLVKEAYQILKEIDPNITVVSPSMTTVEEGIVWLEKFLRDGVKNYADVIGYHFYVPNGTPEKMLSEILRVKKVMAKYGVEKMPLWNTETGWAGRDPFQDEQKGAAYVARSYILNWLAGIERFYWYDWDSPTGLQLRMTAEDSKTPTPAGIAYGEIQKWLVGARMESCNSNWRKTWICKLTRDNNYQGWIIWHPEGKLDFQIPQEWGVKQVSNLAGDRDKLSGLKLEIGSLPLLLDS